jgi:ATP-dependent Clp protease ATP-binding subunit ClpA
LLASRSIELEVSAEARRWLAENALDSSDGARPLARLIQERIRRPIGDEILFGALQDGGRASVVAAEEGLELSYDS